MLDKAGCRAVPGRHAGPLGSTGNILALARRQGKENQRMRAARRYRRAPGIRVVSPH